MCVLYDLEKSHSSRLKDICKILSAKIKNIHTPTQKSLEQSSSIRRKLLSVQSSSFSLLLVPLYTVHVLQPAFNKDIKQKLGVPTVHQVLSALLSPCSFRATLLLATEQ